MSGPSGTESDETTSGRGLDATTGETGVSGDVVARAKAALEGVTEGPWEMRDSFVYPLSISARLGGIRPGDAEFIAASRSLVPELLVEVERLRQLAQSACTCNLPAGVHDDFHANNCAWRLS